MVINNATASINFFPFVSFDGVGDVTIQVWHKNTKTLVEGIVTPTLTDSKVSITLPSLTSIADVADDLDTCLIRVLNDNALIWEYVATWSTESTNINKEFKSWDKVDTEAPQWITI